MTLALTIPGATFTNYVDITELPLLATAKAYFLFGGDQATSLTNRGDNTTAGTVVGSVSFGASYAQFASGLNNKIKTGNTIADSKTFVFASTEKTSIGDFQDGGTIVTQNNASQLYAIRDGKEAQRNHAATPAGNYQFAAMLNNTATNIFTAAAITPTDGLVKTASTLAWSADETSAVGIGHIFFNPGTTTRAACFAAFNRLLTDAELNSIYAYWKFLLARRGLTLF